jgi:CDP-glucose 4,6-dehydratase
VRFLTSTPPRHGLGPSLLTGELPTRRAMATGLEAAPRSHPQAGELPAQLAVDPWAERTVLVTGAGGFIASWICKTLVDAGSSVIGIVRDSVGEQVLRRRGLLDRIILLRGSITDDALVERALNEYEVDTCLHLAAQTQVGVSNRSPLSTFESNIKGTWNVLEACRVTSSVARVVVASSDKAYGDQPALPYREDTPLHGRYPYDASKVCTDVLAQSYAATFGLPVAITRCANVYGGGDLNWARLVPGVIRAILRGKPPVIRSDGTPERDYLYVGDAAAAYLALAERAGETGITGRAFNFGWGQPISAMALVERILSAAGSSLRPEVLGRNKGEINRQFLDSSCARELLQWQPHVTLADGLASTLAWYDDYFGAVEPHDLAVGVR